MDNRVDNQVDNRMDNRMESRRDNLVDNGERLTAQYSGQSNGKSSGITRIANLMVDLCTNNVGGICTSFVANQLDDQVHNGESHLVDNRRSHRVNNRMCGLVYKNTKKEAQSNTDHSLINNSLLYYISIQKFGLRLQMASYDQYIFDSCRRPAAGNARVVPSSRQQTSDDGSKWQRPTLDDWIQGLDHWNADLFWTRVQPRLTGFQHDSFMLLICSKFLRNRSCEGQTFAM